MDLAFCVIGEKENLMQNLFLFGVHCYYLQSCVNSYSQIYLTNEN